MGLSMKPHQVQILLSRFQHAHVGVVSWGSGIFGDAVGFGDGDGEVDGGW